MPDKPVQLVLTKNPDGSWKVASMSKTQTLNTYKLSEPFVVGTIRRLMLEMEAVEKLGQ